jgi:hypothetical protein
MKGKWRALAVFGGLSIWVILAVLGTAFANVDEVVNESVAANAADAPSLVAWILTYAEGARPTLALLVGLVGGFAAGYCYRGLFTKGSSTKASNPERERAF